MLSIGKYIFPNPNNVLRSKSVKRPVQNCQGKKIDSDNIVLYKTRTLCIYYYVIQNKKEKQELSWGWVGGEYLWANTWNRCQFVDLFGVPQARKVCFVFVPFKLHYLVFENGSAIFHHYQPSVSMDYAGEYWLVKCENLGLGHLFKIVIEEYSNSGYLSHPSKEIHKPALPFCFLG